MTIFLSLSGGMDSSTVAGMAVETGEDVLAVWFDYGQRHSVEVHAAQAVAQHYGIELRPMSLPRLSSPSLTEGQEVPEGHYAWDTMKATVVQGRNLLFASTLVGMTQPGDSVWLGVHTGDHAIYPDCRPEFIAPLHEAVSSAYGVSVLAPLLYLSKAEIAARGAEIGVPFDLTWSCYKGGEVHCGRCGTCVERAEAFHLAGVDDPTTYEDSGFWKGVRA